MSDDAGGRPDELAGTGLPGLPDARIRTAGPGDAASLLRLQQRLDQETSFMLFEPGERGTSTEDLARRLDQVARSGNSVVIVADVDGDLAGYVELAGGSFRRSRATAYLVIGVVGQASGKGVGAALLTRARDWAAGHGLHRLELTVMARNHRAADLYRRMGFSIEGRRAQCLFVDGRFIDELYMAALLPGQNPADPTAGTPGQHTA
jgi:RimJ/RimL family protein N-acetyltransferase